MCITEVMWHFVLMNPDLMDVALKYTIKFLLVPVSLSYTELQCVTLCDVVLGFSPVSILFPCCHATAQAKEREGTV